MFERFTDRARRVLALAQEEARLLNHNFIGTEHILLGLIAEGDGLAARALSELGISLEAARSRVEETIGPAGSSTTGSPPFTPRAKKVLELGLREGLQLGHNYIGTEHILLGLVREGEGVAAQALVSLGAELLLVRQKVMQVLSGAPEEDWTGATMTAPMAPVEPPRCPTCGATLIEGVRYRTVAVPPGPEESSDQVMSVPLIYCQSCGSTLGTYQLP